MREIKFRAKRIDNGAWAYGSGVLIADDYSVIDVDSEMYEDEKYEWCGATHFYRVAGAKCDTSTLGQFTGLKDENEKEIYEGDVVDWTFFYACGGLQGAVEKDITLRGVIRWGTAGFIFEVWENDFENAGWYGISSLNFDSTSDIEVIGNIYDNPELVEQ